MANIQTLAKNIAQKHLISEKAAEEFVKGVFGFLEESLRTEKQVKIKGLGTFKITSVAPRESVDVNTGERILIEGRDKINFTPDNTLRDLVNRPFAQFETIILSDQIDIEAMENLTVEQISEVSAEAKNTKKRESAEIDGQTVNTILPIACQENTLESNQNISTIEEVPNALQTFEDNKDDAQIESVKQHMPIHKKDTIMNRTEKTVDTTSDAQEKEFVTNEQLSQRLVELLNAQQQATPTPNPTRSRIEQELLEALERSNKKVRQLTTILTASLVFIGITIFFICMQIFNFWRTDTQMRPETNVIPPKEQVDKKVTHKPAAKASIQKNDSKKTNSPQKKDLLSQKTDSEKLFTDFVANAQTKTGAYNIIGIEKTVAVKAGQTLSSISRTYLGPGMECYIQAANGGRTEFKEGEKIRIPQLQHKKAKK